MSYILIDFHKCFGPFSVCKKKISHSHTCRVQTSVPSAPILKMALTACCAAPTVYQEAETL